MSRQGNNRRQNRGNSHNENFNGGFVQSSPRPIETIKEPEEQGMTMTELTTLMDARIKLHAVPAVDVQSLVRDEVAVCLFREITKMWEGLTRESALYIDKRIAEHVYEADADADVDDATANYAEVSEVAIEDAGTVLFSTAPGSQLTTLGCVGGYASSVSVFDHPLYWFALACTKGNSRASATERAAAFALLHPDYVYVKDETLEKALANLGFVVDDFFSQ